MAEGGGGLVRTSLELPDNLLQYRTVDLSMSLLHPGKGRVPADRRVVRARPKHPPMLPFLLAELLA